MSPICVLIYCNFTDRLLWRAIRCNTAVGRGGLVVVAQDVSEGFTLSQYVTKVLVLAKDGTRVLISAKAVTKAFVFAEGCSRCSSSPKM